MAERKRLKDIVSKEDIKQGKALYKERYKPQTTAPDSTERTPIDRNKIGKNTERQKRREERNENIKSFLEDFGQNKVTTSVTKKNENADSALKWAGKQVSSGLAGFNESLAQAADWVLPTEVLFGEDNRVDRFLDSWTKDREVLNRAAEESTKGKGQAWKLPGELISGTAAAVPNLAVTAMTMGASAVPTLGAAAQAASTGGILNTIKASASTLSKNPTFWLSFLQSTGADYAESKAMGQDNLKSTVSAFVTGLINSAIEMGGGLETLPAALKSGNKSLIRTWIGNALDEGKEEVVQGIISGLVDKVQMGEGMFEGQNVFDPRRMATEFGMGAAVGGILGGATTGLSAMADYGARADLGSRIRRESPYYADEVVERGLASDADSAFYAEATKALERLNKGKTLSDAQLGGLYREERRNANREFNYDTAGYLNELISERGRSAEKSDISRVVELYGDSGKKALSNNYNPDDDFVSYSSGFLDYYKAGTMGTAIDEVESEYDVKPHVKEAAYMAGKNDTLAAKTEQTERAEFTTINGNKPGFADTDASQGISRSLKKTLNLMGQAAEAKIIFEGQVEEGKANGKLSGDVISIARDSENPYFVVAVHEGTHRLKTTSPKEYNAFKSYALDLAAKMSGKTVDEVIAQKVKQYAEGGVNLTPEGAEDEIVAEFAERLFADEQELRAFVSKADRTVVQKIFDAIRDFLDKLKNLRKRKDLDAETLEQLGLAISEVEKAKQLWGKALEATQSKKGKAGKETQNEQQYSLKSPAPTFYSKMEREIEATKQAKLGAKSVIPMLKGKGIKDEEIKWSGIEEFLADKKSVSKDELLEFVRGNQLQIETKTFNKSDTSTEAIGEFADVWNRILGEYMDENEVIESLEYDPEAVWNRILEEYEDENIDEEQRGRLEEALRAAIDEVEQGGATVDETKWSDYKLDGGSNYRELIFKMPGSNYSNNAMSTHWTVDEAGVLAHARVQDFDVDGGKMLFIEEIQSDWHNEGQKRGYKRKDVEEDISKAEFELRKIQKQLDNKRFVFSDKAETQLEDRVENPEQIAMNLAHTIKTVEEAGFLLKFYGLAKDLEPELREIVELQNKESEVRRRLNEFKDSRSSNVPDAPFRDNYHEYVLKSLLRDAAENGYDSIGWTTGKIQENRWSSEYAEGYRIEYDQDIPKFLRKYGKKWGAKVEKTFTAKDVERNGRTYNFGEEIWKMDITDSMRESVIYEGQPMYSLKSAAENLGLEYDEKTNSLAPQYSLKTWQSSKYMQNRTKTLKDLSKKMGVSVEELEKYVEDISSLASLILADPERLDYESNVDPNASVLKKNSEYTWTLDMSTLCAKRLIYTGTMDAIQKALPNAVLTSEDIVEIRDRMMKKGYEVACGICYVESTRREMGAITQQFIDRYKEAQKTGKPISRLNSKGEAVELSETGNKNKRFYADKEWTPTLADLNTTAIDQVKMEHPEAYGAYLSFMNARGQAKPKLLETRAEYKHEIAKWNKSTVSSRNAAGGLRVQSFSDFEVPHMIDMMQAVFDMYTVGLKSQAYTKVPEFAAVFGGTGMKINLSLIAKDDGLDADGNLIFDDVEGIDHKRAFELREQYSKNVGTILVGKTFNHIVKALADPRIDFVIPFHKSSWKESLYDKLGLTGYEDFTATQNEKSIDPNRKIKNFDPSEYWDFNKTGDENAQIYLEKCREDGRIPKFPEFSHYPGYWKLLIDFKMYDNDGVGSPQMTVQPNFNMDEAYKILGAYEEGHRNFPVAQDVADEFVKDYKADGRQFSLKGTSNLLKENARLREYNDYLKNEFKLTKGIKPDKKAMTSLTKAILKDYQSNVEQDVIQPQLDALYDYIANDPAAEWETAKEKALNIASDMLRDATAVDLELQQEFKDFKEYLKDYRISISDEAKGDFKGEWNEFRKRNFGWLTIANDGENIDKVYQGLADMFPQHFDENITNEADQLMEVEKVYNQLKNIEYNPYSNEMEAAAEYLANDIIDRFYDVPKAKPTYADKKQAQIDKIRRESKQKVREAVRKERERGKKKADAYKAKRDESQKKMSDRRQRKILREKILRHIKPMHQKLTSPTDKKHVPEKLKASVARVLACIDTSSNRLNSKGEETKRTKAFADAKEQLQAIAGETNLDPALFGDGDNKNNFEELLNTLNQKKLDDMNIEELNVVWEVVRAMETAINNYNKMLAQSRFATVVDFADAFDESTKNRKAKTGRRNDLSLDTQTPLTFFNNFGEAGMAFYRMLRDAQDYEATILVELAERVANTVSRKQRKQFEKEAHTFNLENGESLTLTKAHIMELYVGVKREQFAQHLYGDGLVQPEVGKNVRRGTDALTVTEADVAKMFETLTDEEKKVAEGMQKLTLFLAEKGNEASMKAYGYKKFNDPFYWPIKSAKEGVQQTVEKGEGHPRSIANMGSAKPLTPGANNALELNGMFKTFDQHTVDMTTYAAWLLPMEDANRLFNFRFKTQDANGDWVKSNRTMKGIINKFAGEGGDEYWTNLMRDIQNGIGRPADTGTGKVINKLIGNVKKASVAGNLRVVVQQPTAYLRALAVLGVTDMEIATAKARATKGKGWEKALEYAPIAARKAMGGFDISTSSVEEYLYVDKKNNGKDKTPLRELPMWGASKADEVTWGWIWNACEANIQRTQKTLQKGTEEFYEAVAKKFTEVVDQTQVVDGVLQRSQLMRTNDENVKALTMFMGEPIMSLNLLYRAYDSLRYQTGKARSEGFKKLGRATIALLASNVAVAVMQSVVDGARDDESDEDYVRRVLKALTGITGKEETWWDFAKNVAIGGNLGDSLNVLNWHPFINELMSSAKGFKSERLDAQAVGNLISSGREVVKAFTGDSKMTIGNATKKTIETGAKLLGSSVANVTRDIESILRSVLTGTDNWYAHYTVEKLKYKVSESPNHFIDIAYLALMHENYSDYERIRADMIANGVDEKKIDSKLKSKAVSDEKAGKKAYDNLVAELKREGLESLDKEVQERILADAEEVVASSNLRQLSRNSYKEEYDWITEAQNSKQNLGVSTAEYLMLREEYSSRTLTSETVKAGLKQANADGIIDAETYLEYNKMYNSTKSDKGGASKKQKLEQQLLNSGLTKEEINYIWFDVFEYKKW